MSNLIDILKGVHPGLFLQRELNNRNMKSGRFAESIGEHPQTMSAIIRGRRSMNIPLSLRIEHALGLEEGMLMTLQVHYDIVQEKRKLASVHHPDLDKYRPSLFWDTSFDKIDWDAHSNYVINRVMERGNKEEIVETIRFYGRETILSKIGSSPSSLFSSVIKKNLKQYLDYET